MNTHDSESFVERIDPARLRTFMRTYLRLAAESTDEQIRAALFKRDDGLLAWFDNRLGTIERYLAPRVAERPLP
jgi:hypothetical protein